ncbi:MFS transporter [Pseudomonas sp. CLCA07]
MTIRIGLLPQVAAAHFVSHLHIMVLAALFPLLPAFFNVDYVELGLALSLFNIVTALVQAPMGFAVDRHGARRLLLVALALGSSSFLLIALLPGYTCLLIGMALAGVANAIYHPADYALLSRHIDPAHIGKAFSVHTFAGFLGAAVAPVFLLGIAVASNPAMAFAAAALVGFVALALLLIPGSALAQVSRLHPAADPPPLGARRLSLLSPMVLSLTLLFVLLNLSTGAIEKFSVAALMQGQGVALTWANSALTAFLFASAFGVLAGGALADRRGGHAGRSHRLATSCTSSRANPRTHYCGGAARIRRRWHACGRTRRFHHSQSWRSASYCKFGRVARWKGKERPPQHSASLWAVHAAVSKAARAWRASNLHGFISCSTVLAQRVRYSLRPRSLAEEPPNAAGADSHVCG